MQPYYFPAIHYYQLIFCSDIFVILDNVNFINKGFIHKNYFIDTKTKEKKIFNISIEKKSQNKLIKDLKLIDFKKSLQKIELNYKKNEFYENIQNTFLQKKILNKNYKLVIDLLETSIRELCILLEIKTKIVKASSLKENDFYGQEKIADYVIQLDGREYVNFLGGSHLYDKLFFEKKKIKLRFLESKLKDISQVSIFDILAKYSIADIKKNFLPKYHLIN